MKMLSLEELNSMSKKSLIEHGKTDLQIEISSNNKKADIVDQIKMQYRFMNMGKAFSKM